MPDLSTVNSALDAIAAQLRPRRHRLTVQELDWVVEDMVRHPEEYGAWDGPNWNFYHIRPELCQRLWNTPVHPTEVPSAYRGLPWRVQYNLLVLKVSPEHLANYKLTPTEAVEWLMACAANRRYGANDWRVWLDDPIRWRFRHVSDAAYAALKHHFLCGTTH